MKRLIVIEGVDASGKQTHAEELFRRLCAEGVKVKKISFPNYESPSSSIVKMYLAGEFGKSPDDVNPFAASAFYAVDRYASYKKDWENYGGIVIADRYVTSNMIHQAAKIRDKYEKDAFLEWVWDFEYNKLGLPVPDIVFFFDMPPEFSQRLISERNNKITGRGEKDIHEKDFEYLKLSYENALYVAKKYAWEIIPCVKDGVLRSIDDRQAEIYEIIKRAGILERT